MYHTFIFRVRVIECGKWHWEIMFKFSISLLRLLLSWCLWERHGTISSRHAYKLDIKVGFILAKRKKKRWDQTSIIHKTVLINQKTGISRPSSNSPLVVCVHFALFALGKERISFIKPLPHIWIKQKNKLGFGVPSLEEGNDLFKKQETNRKSLTYVYQEIRRQGSCRQPWPPTS